MQLCPLGSLNVSDSGKTSTGSIREAWREECLLRMGPSMLNLFHTLRRISEDLRSPSMTSSERAIALESRQAILARIRTLPISRPVKLSTPEPQSSPDAKQSREP